MRLLQRPSIGFVCAGATSVQSTVLAGLALRFDSTMGQSYSTKAAYWQRFENVKLSNSDNLTLGHCTTSESAQIRSQEKHASKVSIIAGKNCFLWRLQCMWGM